MSERIPCSECGTMVLAFILSGNSGVCLKCNNPNVLSYKGSYDENDSDEIKDQLWIMMKLESFFMDDFFYNLEDELVEQIESKNLGTLDGHSSGGYQFDMNFYKVTDYEKTKAEIVKFMKEKYPQIKYVISKEYETTFDSF